MNNIDDRLIELKELRIGNILEYKGDLVQVTSLSCDIDDEYQDQLCFVKFGTSTNEKGGWNRSLVNDLKRIPLTGALLERCGFKYYYSSWYRIALFNETRYLNYSVRENGWSIQDGEDDDVVFKGPLFLHQLQNLYFSVAGEELTIKEPMSIEEVTKHAIAVPGNQLNVKIFGIERDWIEAGSQTPAEWGAENHWGNGEGRHRVKLQDGREIFTWWYNGQWSVERLMPHLKVAFWKRPVVIA